MGTLRQGAMCEFCFRREAHGYIPDPYCAPLCNTCDELGNTRGDDAIGTQRIDTLVSMWVATRTSQHGRGLPAIFGVVTIRRLRGTFMWDEMVIPSHMIAEWVLLSQERAAQRLTIRAAQRADPVTNTA